MKLLRCSLLVLTLVIGFIAIVSSGGVLPELVWYEDLDGDSFGNPANTIPAIEGEDPPNGYVTNSSDCDDTDENINPDGTEICGDTIDQDCSGSDLVCGDPDNDFDGYTVGQGDCDDDDDSINPDASELPDNEVDEDCNGYDAKTWYLDSDTDGYGDSTQTLVADSKPTGYVSDDTDCNDGESTIHPNADEICGDTIDQDCDESDLVCATTWYRDSDFDGYGDPTNTTEAVDQPIGYVADDTDCDDGNAAANPNETEHTGNAVDEDCDGTAQNTAPTANAGTYADVDQDTDVSLDGSGSSDPDDYSNPSYTWDITAPDSSLISLSGVSPSFTADQVGTYNINLVYSDGLLSDSDNTTVTSNSTCTPTSYTTDFNNHTISGSTIVYSDDVWNWALSGTIDKWNLDSDRLNIEGKCCSGNTFTITKNFAAPVYISNITCTVHKINCYGSTDISLSVYDTTSGNVVIDSNFRPSGCDNTDDKDWSINREVTSVTFEWDGLSNWGDDFWMDNIVINSSCP